MPTFTIQPSDDSAFAGITASGAAGVLRLVQQLVCKQADVSMDGEYSFSVRLADNGLWCIYQRDEQEPNVLPLAG